jgi:hypothetical protein
VTALWLVPADARDAGFDMEGPYTVSDALGNFTFPAVPAGQYSLQARMGTPRSRSDVGRRRQADGRGYDRDITGVGVVLQPGFRISGRLEFEGGLERPTPQALQQVPVFIHPAGPATLTAGPVTAARVEGDGRFTTAGLPPGRYFVRITGSPKGWRFNTRRRVADVPPFAATLVASHSATLEQPAVRFGRGAPGKPSLGCSDHVQQ